MTKDRRKAIKAGEKEGRKPKNRKIKRKRGSKKKKERMKTGRNKKERTKGRRERKREALKKEKTQVSAVTRRSDSPGARQLQVIQVTPTCPEVPERRQKHVNEVKGHRDRTKQEVTLWCKK